MSEMETALVQTWSQEPLIYGGERVITLAMMDELHKRPEGTAGRNFREHRSKMEEGRHFFELPADEFRRLGIRDHGGGTPGILLTEWGYLKLVKAFRDDLAWDVQEMLIRGYFRSQALQTPIQIRDFQGIAEQITNGLRPIIQPLVDGHHDLQRGQDNLRKDVDEIKGNVHELKDAVESIVPRKAIPRSVQKRHLAFVFKCGGKCPRCNMVAIMDEFGTPIAGVLEWDHFRARNRVKIYEVWPLCKQCHGTLTTSPAAKRESEREFEAYQAKRERWDNAQRPMLPWTSA